MVFLISPPRFILQKLQMSAVLIPARLPFAGERCISFLRRVLWRIREDCRSLFRRCPGLADKLSGSTACSDGRYYYIGNYVYDTENQQWSKIRTEQSGVELSSKGWFNGKVYYRRKQAALMKPILTCRISLTVRAPPQSGFLKPNCFWQIHRKRSCLPDWCSEWNRCSLLL